jgi:periodic tryptophan protein 2
MSGRGFDYGFQNLCGVVYKCGNVHFTPVGNELLSAVGNRITKFDLEGHKSTTLPFEARKNIAVIALSGDGRFLLCVDVDGRGLLVSFITHRVLHRINFKGPVSAARFSPDDAHVAVVVGSKLSVWVTPQLERDVSPFGLHRSYSPHFDDISAVEWSSDDRFLLTASKDTTVRIYSRDPVEGFAPCTLTGHRDQVVRAFFGAPAPSAEAPSALDGADDVPRTIFSVARDGAVFEWERDAEAAAVAARTGARAKSGARVGRDGGWVVRERHFIQPDHARVHCAALHAGRRAAAAAQSDGTAEASSAQLLVVGFSSGVFGLYHMPGCQLLHTLSMGQHCIDTVSINWRGDWIAFGSARLGQLLVWEWRSETYVLKQQGHFYDLNAVDFSPDGQLLATGGDDGKLKLWNTDSGFCFVTFKEHTAPVSALAFVPAVNAVVSASMDGTVRAFDLVRYRNFRTMVTPTPAQLTSLAVDPSGDVVVAGAIQPFDIYMWNLRTGRLIEVLPGHSGPISSLAFAPASSAEAMLASGSWDKTVKLWSLYQKKPASGGTGAIGERAAAEGEGIGNGSLPEELAHDSDVLAIAFRPDGRELCGATLSGALCVWDTREAKQTGHIDGRKDLAGGRRAGDTMAANSKNAPVGRCFTSVCYTADGSCLIAGGRSTFVCIYEVTQGLLLRRFRLSRNLSLQGVQEHLHSSLLTDAGSAALLKVGDDAALDKQALPGIAGDRSSRRLLPEVRSKAVKFSPTGDMWAAATTEGLLVYALSPTPVFAPIALTLGTTPDAARSALAREEWTKALVIALHLTDLELTVEVCEAIAPDTIATVVEAMPPALVPRLVTCIAQGLEASVHLDLWLRWSLAALQTHGIWLRRHIASAAILPTVRALYKAVVSHAEALSKTCRSNQHSLQFLVSLAKFDAAGARAEDALGAAAAAAGAEQKESMSAADAAAAEEDGDGDWASNWQ